MAKIIQIYIGAPPRLGNPDSETTDCFIDWFEYFKIKKKKLTMFGQVINTDYGVFPIRANL